MSIDYLTGCRPYVPGTPFRKWVESALPGVYDESLSLYELMAKLLKSFGDVVERVDGMGETSNGLLLAFTQLKTVMEKAAADMDVENRVRVALEEAAENGTLEELIQVVLDEMQVEVEVDATLTMEGMAADAKATGDELRRKVDTAGVNSAVNVALARAKANGDFKGDKGDKGDKGEDITITRWFNYTPLNGDRVTRIVFSDGTTVDVPHGANGGYYTPAVSQNGNELTITFTGIGVGLPPLEPVVIELPSGSGSGQNVNPVAKTEDMTQPVGVDENGQLYTAPGGGGSDYALPIGGDELGGVKNGGNVTINADGTMTAPVGTGGGLSDDAKNLLLVILQNAAFLSDQKSNIEALAAALSTELPDAETETWDYEWDYSQGLLANNGWTYKDGFKEWEVTLDEIGELTSYIGSRNSYAVKALRTPAAFSDTTAHAIMECVIQVKIYETDTTVDQGFVIVLGDGTNSAAIYADNKGFVYNGGWLHALNLDTEYKVRLEFDSNNGVKCSINGKEVLNTADFNTASNANTAGKKTALVQVATGATYIKSVKYREVKE